MPVSLSNHRFRKGLRGEGWATVEYYGAKGNVAVDDRAAIQAGIDDLAGIGGRLYFGPKYYRIDGTLTTFPGVSMIGVSCNSTHLVINHATQAIMIPIQGSNYRLPTVISDINFGALVPNTGAAIDYIGICGQEWLISRCTFNDPFGYPQLLGTFFRDDANSPGNVVTFEDCYGSILGSVSAFQMNRTASRTNFIRGTYKMPSSYNTEIMGFYTGGGLVDGVSFDLSTHSTGNGVCITANTTGDNDTLIVNNTRTYRPGSLIGTRVFLKALDGAYVRTSNIWTRGCTRYSTAGVMGIGSAIEPEAHYSDIPGSLTYNIRNNYSNVALWLTLSGNPSINMPSTGMHLGQRMTVSVTNISGSTIGGYFIGNMNGYSPTSILNGRTVTWTAEYSSNSVGVGHWMLIGTPAVAYIA
jgi:hypothetical protein